MKPLPRIGTRAFSLLLAWTAGDETGHADWKIMFIGCAIAFLISGLAGFGVDARIPLMPKDTESPDP